MKPAAPEYSRLQRLGLGLAGVVGWGLVHALNRMVRYQRVREEQFRELRRKRNPVILCFWHNQIFSGAWLFRRQGIVVMTSRHLDGEYIARVIQCLGFGTARGSSSRGGVSALREMARGLRQGTDVAFTVDGPRGPCYQAKPGPIQLARLTGAPILPFHVEVEDRWEFRSWDRFRIPKPLSRGVLLFGELITVADDQPIEPAHTALQQQLNRLRAEAENWFRRSASTGPQVTS